jgi:ATP-dependent protease ClpP protease subunit
MTIEIGDIDNLTPLPKFSQDWEKMRPYLFNGLALVIEFLEGDERSKVKGNGVIIKNIMPAAYGYILRTTDVHGEEIDVYIANLPDENSDIFVIDQVNPDTGLFDEHKVMVGFNNSDEACIIYKEVFGDGSGEKRLGAITTFPGKTFHDWIGTEGYSLMPAAKYGVQGVTTLMLAGIKSPPPSSAMQPKPLDESGGVIIDIPDLSRGPKLKTIASENDKLEYHLYLFSALETEVWSNTVDTFVRTLDLAKDNDEVHIHIASPGGSVFLMGRIVSAIRATKAKVITYAQGCVASAATTVWMSGHERHILPGSYFMQHMSSQGLGGKSSDIAAKAAFCVEYISAQLQPAIEIGLFTDQEIRDMVASSADIYISGREAKARIDAKLAQASY